MAWFAGRTQLPQVYGSSVLSGNVSPNQSYSSFTIRREPMQQHPIYQATNIRRLIGVLQQWQVLLAPSCALAVTEVTLADVQAVTLALQQTFGLTASLETIIQHLVGQDLREQLEQRQVRSHLAEAVA
jgi:hypothetical protein